MRRQHSAYVMALLGAAIGTGLAACGQLDPNAEMEPVAATSSALTAVPMVSKQFCAQYTVGYDDASTTIGDDFFVDNTPKAARGAKINITRNSDGTCVFCDFTPDDGADAGCTPTLLMTPSETYTIKVLATASVAGQTVTVRNDDVNNLIWSYVYSTSYVPGVSLPGAPPITMTTGSHAAWNIAAAAGFAVHRRSAGLVGESFGFYTQPCPGSGVNCNSGGSIYIVNDTRKYVIVHEMGHAVARKANGGANAAFAYGAAEDACPSTSGHDLASKEYQSAAINEGIASYYAAVAFNDPHQSDCTYQLHYKIDWNRDGVVNESQTLSCEDGGTQGIGAGDYLGQFCLGSGVSINRGTQFDWMRFFWDLDSKEGLDAADIFELWSAAGPDTWNATGDVWDANNPAVRMEAAAAGLGFATAWANQVTVNGVYR